MVGMSGESWRHKSTLKAYLHCTLEPVSTNSGTGSARPHWNRFHSNRFEVKSLVE